MSIKKRKTFGCDLGKGLWKKNRPELEERGLGVPPANKVARARRRPITPNIVKF